MRGCLVAGVLLAAGAGCSKEAYTLAPVSGRVTLNGDPLPNASINFQPIGEGKKEPGPGSFGRTDADGRYTLYVVGTKRKGAVVGNHRVTVSTQSGDPSRRDADDRPPPPEKIPARYNAPTTLTCEVPPGGRSDADLALTAP